MALDSTNLLAILAMALATYGTRVAGLWLAGRVPQTGRARAALDALPAAVLVAIIAPAAAAGPAEIVATAATAVAATRLPLIAVVAIGVATVIGMRLVVG
ncbi:MAG TPA: AzlD domain-containing protein [Alphaproteobacteria bacterium]|nr:AzlD domain-containing protein [Alphaproteobacteria bacterium]